MPGALSAKRKTRRYWSGRRKMRLDAYHSYPLRMPILKMEARRPVPFLLVYDYPDLGLSA